MNKESSEKLEKIIDLALNMVAVSARLLVDKPYGGRDATIPDTIRHLAVVNSCIQLHLNQFMADNKEEQ
jgi:pyruvate-formate lyase-activating enzyme